jgi:hypothetical protein
VKKRVNILWVPLNLSTVDQEFFISRWQGKRAVKNHSIIAIGFIREKGNHWKLFALKSRDAILTIAELRQFSELEYTPVWFTVTLVQFIAGERPLPKEIKIEELLTEIRKRLLEQGKFQVTHDAEELLVSVNLSNISQEKIEEDLMKCSRVEFEIKAINSKVDKYQLKFYRGHIKASARKIRLGKKIGGNHRSSKSNVSSEWATK